MIPRLIFALERWFWSLCNRKMALPVSWSSVVSKLALFIFSSYEYVKKRKTRLSPNVILNFRAFLQVLFVEIMSSNSSWEQISRFPRCHRFYFIFFIIFFATVRGMNPRNQLCQTDENEQFQISAKNKLKINLKKAKRWHLGKHLICSQL